MKSISYKNFFNHRPKMLSMALFLFLSISQAANLSAASTYYVSTSGSDSNPGTQTLPWQTIGKANSVMVAGDTTIVSSGTYAESLTTSTNGIAGKQITFKASGIVNVNGEIAVMSDYITIDGFTLTTDMNLSGSNCQILNNHFINARVYMPLNNANCLLKGNHIESNNNWKADWVAFDLGGSNHILENNEIGPSTDTDAFRPFGIGHIIRNNYIHDITLSPNSGAHMDIFQVFSDNGETSYNIVFEKNRIINSQGQMFMTSMDGHTTVHDFDVRNNLWVNVQLQGNVGIPNFRFYNNTLFNVGTENGMVLYLFDYPNATEFSHARIMNNIFIGSASPYAIGSNGTDIITDYNFIADGQATGFAKLSGFGETHGINGGDPKFVSSSTYDFHLQAGSPAIDRGTTISSFSNDIENIKRPQGGAWDIGAFEYTSSTPVLVLAAPTNLRIQ